MCGINGIIKRKSDDGDLLKHDIAKMNRAIKHRGPDGTGEFINGRIALGHLRLAILDLSEDGAQPMFNEDRSLALVFNGEIYNYLELRAELQSMGYRFHSATDSEVVLNGYAEWGDECVQRFNGMWAFAIWDSRKNRLLLSRDRLGVKPVYYRIDDEGLVFSSEIKGIAAVRQLRSANLGKVHDYLAYGYRASDGETFFEGVNELKGGHQLVWQNGESTLTRYWQLPPPVDLQENRPDEHHCQREFVHLLEDAVRLRFRSDVPVALLQSGGLDSSTIARIVNDSIEEGSLDRESVTAFTADFPGFEMNETPTVRAFLNTCPEIRLRPLTVTGKDLAENLGKFVYQMDEPVYGTTSFAHWSLMKEIHNQGIKVVINGQGADEALGGYGRLIIGYRLLDALLQSFREFVKQTHAVSKHMGLGAGTIITQIIKAAIGRRAASRFRARFTEGSLGALNPRFHREHASRLCDLRATTLPRNLDQHLRTQLDHYGFGQILHYEDHGSMAHSVEIRSPFVDYRLMEYAFRIPDTMKLDMGVTKRILRESFKSRLPASLIENHQKIGFNTPTGDWLKTPEMEKILKDLFSSPEFNGRSLWRSRVIRKKFQQGDWSKFPLWRFINVELWARAYGLTNL